MTEEFALCWNNFTENIVSGFSILQEDESLCDVTLAVEGKLLKAHKMVLSLSSPYFKSMFNANPCQHPIIFLKDVQYKLVQHLLDFIYLGKTNVKHVDLQAFMEVAESLQIKGLSTNNKKIKEVIDATGERKTREDVKRSSSNFESTMRTKEPSQEEPNPKEAKLEDITDLTNEDDGESTSTNDIDLIPVPEVLMIESNFDTAKSENLQTSLKIACSQSLSSDCYDPSIMNERLISENPNCSNSSITMLSSTSLLHGNCIFNRNNTVATQQGLKTYWLCKSYRINMCKARCITHQGKVISATGLHNHVPHMNNKSHEIPPGHSPNPLYSDFLNPSISNALSVSSNQPLIMQPYQYLHHPLNSSQTSPVMQNSARSMQSFNEQNISPLSESNVDTTHFKVENL